MNTLGGVYTTGTLTIAGDRTTVTGVGTMWGPIAETGDWLLINGQVGLILTVTGDTSMTLQSQWQGTLPSASTYVLLKMSWLRYEPALTQAKLRELLAELEDAGNFVYTDVAPPDSAIGNDGDWALKTNEQPWQVWYKTGGVWVEQRPPGFVWKGSWLSTTTYGINDVVERLGSSYVAILENINQPPETFLSLYWNLMAASGTATIAPSSINPVHLNSDTPVEQIAFRDRLNFVTRDAAGDTMQGNLTGLGTANVFGSGVGLNKTQLNGGTSIGPMLTLASLGSEKIKLGFASALINSGYDETFGIWVSGVGTALKVAQSGVVSLPGTVLSTDKNTGALVVGGGVGIGGALYAARLNTVQNGTYDILTGGDSSTGTGMLIKQEMSTRDHEWWENSGAGWFNLLKLNTTRLHVNVATASASPWTGALTVAGGVGVGGAISVGGTSQFGAGSAPVGNISNVFNQDIALASGGPSLIAFNSYYNAGFRAFNTGPGFNIRMDQTTWDLQISGAVQVGAGAEQTMRPICTFNAYYPNVTVNSTVASTSPTTGALTVVGGVGVGGALNVGGAIKVNGAAALNGQVSVNYDSSARPCMALQAIGASTAGELIAFLGSGGGAAGSVTYGAGQTSVAYNTSSDARGKPNREPLSPDTARTVIDALEVYDFDKDGNRIRGIGLVAQQAHAVHNSLATPGRTDADWWMTEKAAPMPFVIVNVQQLNQRLDEVERKLGGR